MKNYPAFLAVAVLGLLAAAGPGAAQTVPFQHTRLTKLWETKADLKAPGSVVFDSQRRMIYVSNASDGIERTGSRGFISRISAQGEIVELQWVTGVTDSNKLAWTGDRLFVSGGSKLLEIDVGKGRMRSCYFNEKAVDLHGVAAVSTGAVYVADKGATTLFELHDGLFTEFVEDSRFLRSGGVTVVGHELFASIPNAVLSVDLRTHSVRRAFPAENTYDALAAIGDGTFIGADATGALFLLGRNRTPTKLLDNPSGRNGMAEFCYVPAERMLLVSATAANKLVAYRLD